MKVIVAGGRGFNDAELLDFVLQQERDDGMTAVVSGMAAGADRLGFLWARQNAVEVIQMPANWDDLEAPGAVIRTNRWGKPYNANAGFDRNRQMAETGDRLVAFWDGVSPGTRQMIQTARVLGLPVRVVRYEKGER